MDLSRPYADVLTGPRGRVLVTLAQLETPVTVRALARHADVAAQTALDYVKELASAGIAVTQPAGTALLVSLNRHHLASEPLIALATLRARLVNRLREELSGWDGLAGAWLFGSAARGDGDRESDIDLLLVANDSPENAAWTDTTARLRERAREWTGNDVQLIEHTLSSLSRLIDTDDPLVRAIRRDGIPLITDSPSLLRRPT